MKFYQSLYSIIFFAISVLIISCSGDKKELIITNPADIERQDELIVLKRSDIESHIGSIPPGKFVMVLKDSIPVVVQYDDTNADGNWDELAFLYSFKAAEKVKFTFSIADAPAAIKAVVRAHVRHRKKNTDDSFGPVLLKDTMPQTNLPTDFSKTPLPLYLTEGTAWENDKVAFRLYFDTRNGKDIFGKLIPAMIMDTIGADQSKSYHEISNWGMDILHVGNSLGAGSVAIAAKATNGTDTLIRLGGMNIKKETYEVVADGPVRAVFRIKYEWEINEHPVQIVDETSIWGGQFFYETKLVITGTPKYAQAVTGFADFDNNTPGQINMAGSKIFYSYGPQSENKDSLGLAIAIDGKNYGWFSGITDSLSDIQNSYLVSQKFIPGEPVIYRFYSCWEKSDSRFKTETGFQDFLKKEAVLLHSKLKMDWH
jgi:hypothetical protein